MLILAFGNEKGGVGKTTTAYLFATAIALQTNYRILYIDADRQNSSAPLRKIDELFAGNDLQKKRGLFRIINESPENILNAVEKHSQGYDLVLLDLPANTQADGVLAAYSLCDFIFVPTNASELDTDSSQQFISELTEKIAPIRRGTGKETSIILLFTKVNRRAKRYRELYNDVRRFFPLVRNSIPYRESDFQNRGILETMLKSRNKHEYYNFAREVLQVIKI